MNLSSNMPIDEVRLCKGDTCIEARGENARFILGIIAVVLISAAGYYLSKIK